MGFGGWLVGTVLFGALLAIAVLGYMRSSAEADRLDTKRNPGLQNRPRMGNEGSGMNMTHPSA